MKENTEDVVWYAVLKLCKNVSYTHPITGNEHSASIHGIFGYIPCYSTLEEAYEASDCGKYQIIPIKQEK